MNKINFNSLSNQFLERQNILKYDNKTFVVRTW